MIGPQQGCGALRCVGQVVYMCTCQCLSLYGTQHPPLHTTWHAKQTCLHTLHMSILYWNVCFTKATMMSKMSKMSRRYLTSRRYLMTLPAIFLKSLVLHSLKPTEARQRFVCYPATQTRRTHVPSTDGMCPSVQLGGERQGVASPNGHNAHTIGLLCRLWYCGSGSSVQPHAPSRVF